jgi:hypothetical protein
MHSDFARSDISLGRLLPALVTRSMTFMKEGCPG